MADYLGVIPNVKGQAFADSFLKGLEDQRQQKLALAQSLINSGAYAPTAPGTTPPQGLLGRIGQGLVGPQVGGQNMNVGGQNFAFQTPQMIAQAQALKTKATIDALKGITSSQGGPSLGSGGGSPQYLPPSFDISPTGEVKTEIKPVPQKQDVMSQLGLATEGKDINQLKSDLKQNNPGLANYLEDVGNNKLPLRGAFGMSYNQVTELVDSLYRDTYDPTIYPAREHLRRDYTGGQASKSLISLNTALHHSDLAYDQIGKLDNGKILAANTFGNFMKKQINDPSLLKLRTTLSFLNRETPKAIAAGIVTNEDKQSFDNNLNAAQSKEAAQAVVDDYIQLLGGRTQPLFENWQNTFGDYSKFPVMYKSTIPILNKHGFAYDKDTGAITKDNEQPQGKYTVGQTISVGGKNYKVTGGDMNDPDIEEVK